MKYAEQEQDESQLAGRDTQGTPVRRQESVTNTALVTEDAPTEPDKYARTAAVQTAKRHEAPTCLRVPDLA